MARRTIKPFENPQARTAKVGAMMDDLAITETKPNFLHNSRRWAGDVNLALDAGVKPFDNDREVARKLNGSLVDLYEAAAWPPVGALLASDFAGGRYWRSDIGTCTIGDIWETDEFNWFPFNPATHVVPGVGLTKGDITALGYTDVGPVMTADAASTFDLTRFSMFIKHEMTHHGPGLDYSWNSITTAFTDFPDFNNSFASTMYLGFPPDRNALSAFIASADYVDYVGTPSSFAVSIDQTAGTVITSTSGAPGGSASVPGSYAEDKIALLARVFNQAGEGVTSRTVIKSVTIYDYHTQDQLNSLTR